MDQESFRKLLQTPKVGSASTSTSRGSLLAAATKSKQKTVDTTQPAFKPRTVKKKPRVLSPTAIVPPSGVLGLTVEALAEDFERKTADNTDRRAVEEQRHYLGGDSTHTVLVKGLDYALFEQNRSRVDASAAAEDDASLEQAFLAAASTVPRKRTREEIIQELKSKRAKGDAVGEEGAETKQVAAADVGLEQAKKAGKFRPIGFKPIGGDAGEKPKKKVKQNGRGKEEKGKVERKKKRKAETTVAEVPLPPPEAPTEVGPSKPSPTPPQPELKPEPVDDEFDIFADAGDYAGVDLSEDEESESEDKVEEGEVEDRTNEQLPTKGRWFTTEEEPVVSPEPGGIEPIPPSIAEPVPLVGVPLDNEEGEEEEHPVRLQPLASSVLPSIKELLELDSAVGKAGKRRTQKEKNKEKRGAGEGKVDKDKIDRDYKRLKAYTDKKAAASRGKS